METKILVVDDEPAILELIAYHLGKEGFQVVTESDGTGALAAAERERPALVLLDVMLPELDGFSVCQRLRRAWDVPVILLTAKSGETDKVWGLEIGADDYVTKPFAPRELVARVKAVLRRARPAAGDREVLTAGGLAIDLARHQARLDGGTVELTPKEFDLLYTLARHPGRVFTRDHLLREVWGYEYTGGTRTVDVHVRRLRQKLNDDPAAPRFLETVHGIGYRFREQTAARPPGGEAAVSSP